MNMMSAQVPPEVAFVTCDLFSDPNDVYQKGKDYFGEDFWKKDSKSTETLVSGGITNHTNTSTHLVKNEVGGEKGKEDGERGIS